MARSIVEQVMQWGRETTYGTAVAAGKLLPSLSASFDLDALRQNFRAMGYNADTLSVPNGYWAPGSFESPVDYNQATWVFEMLVGTSAPTTPSGGTLSRQWDFAPSSTGRDANKKSYTVEMGDTDAAQQYAGVTGRSLQIAVSRAQGATMRGALIANWPTDGLTLTSSPTAVAQRPATGIQWDVFLDSSYPGIGTDFSNKVTDAFSAGFNLGNVADPFWALNTDTDSPRGTVAIAREITGNVATEHNAQSRGYFAALKSNPKRYLRLQATGNTIEGSIKELLRLDFAFNFETPDRDGDPVYGYNYALRSVYDSTLGGHWKARLINTITTSA